MKAKFLVFFIGLSLLVSFNFTQAQTTATTPGLDALIQTFHQQIKDLEERILQLQGELEQITTELKEAEKVVKFTQNLRKGLKSKDVERLQKFLSKYPEIYPEGLVTGYFGSLTERAVKKFQEKHSDDILKPYELNKGTGFVGEKTIAKINEILAEGAGASEVIPPGLITAPGIQKKVATTTASEEKITICHYPLDNPDNKHTIVVAEPALKEHLMHGDTIGACSEDPEDVCPNIDGIQETIPEGMIQDNEGNCVEPGVVLGCTDETATNYDPDATQDDGTCVYPDTTPPVISNFQPLGTITDLTPTLSLNTDENATCRYVGTTQYPVLCTTEHPTLCFTDQSFDAMPGTFSGAGTTYHYATLETMATGTYTYYARCQDTAGNKNTVSASIIFTITAETADTTAPVISNIQVSNITQTLATITWQTDEESNSVVGYGLTTSYGSTVSGETSVTYHEVNLTNLTDGATYHYKVKSTDSAGNQALSSDKTFTTLTTDLGCTDSDGGKDYYVKGTIIGAHIIGGDAHTSIDYCIDDLWLQEHYCGTDNLVTTDSYICSNGCQDGACSSADTTPPGEVTNFTAIAGNGQVGLSWTNPTDADFTGAKILRKTGNYPANITDGTQVYDGTGASHTDTGLANGTAYYYKAFAYDEVPNYSSGVGATATPTAPSSLTVRGRIVDALTSQPVTNSNLYIWNWKGGERRDFYINSDGTFSIDLTEDDIANASVMYVNSVYISGSACYDQSFFSISKNSDGSVDYIRVNGPGAYSGITYRTVQPVGSEIDLGDYLVLPVTGFRLTSDIPVKFRAEFENGSGEPGNSNYRTVHAMSTLCPIDVNTRIILTDQSGNEYVSPYVKYPLSQHCSYVTLDYADGQFSWSPAGVISAPAFLLKWGSQGSGDGQFNQPHGIAVDVSGNIYVVEYPNNRVQKFTSDGTFITQWGSQGSGDGQFSNPEGIAVDTSGNVYVADKNNSRVQKFTSDGIFITKWGSYGSGDGQFAYPFDIAIDSSDNVYVADYLNHRVQKFTSDGTFITKWGSPGYPIGIAVDASSNVYVTRDNNNFIQKYTGDGASITQWGSLGSGDGQFYNPEGLAVDTSGNVYVADFDNNRVQKFTSDGTLITKWGSQGSGDGQFLYPGGIAVDTSGNVYVADTNNYRIQKFGPSQLSFIGRLLKDIQFQVAAVSAAISDLLMR